MSSASSSSTTDPKMGKIMSAQYKNWFKNPSPYFIVLPDEDNATQWSILVANLDEPFKHGEFIFTFRAGKDFPHKPPEDLNCHTPNGVFETGGKICISIGEFHGDHKAGDHGRTDTWRPSLGMMGFAANVVNSIICFDTLEGGVRIVKEMSKPAMAAFSEVSREFNLKRNRQLYDRFEQFISDNPTLEPVKLLMAGRLKQSSVSTSYARTGDTAQGAASAPAGTATPYLQASARCAALSYTPMTATGGGMQAQQALATMTPAVCGMSLVNTGQYASPAPSSAPAPSGPAAQQLFNAPLAGRGSMATFGGVGGSMGAGFPAAAAPSPAAHKGAPLTPHLSGPMYAGSLFRLHTRTPRA